MRFVTGLSWQIVLPNINRKQDCIALRSKPTGLFAAVVAVETYQLLRSQHQKLILPLTTFQPPPQYAPIYPLQPEATSWNQKSLTRLFTSYACCTSIFPGGWVGVGGNNQV